MKTTGLLADADYAAIGAALDSFRLAAADAAADPCQRSPQSIATRYLLDTPGLAAGVLALLDTPVVTEGEGAPQALLTALLWLLAGGQTLSPFGRRLLTACILRLDHDAILAELAEGGDGEAA